MRTVLLQHRSELMQNVVQNFVLESSDFLFGRLSIAPPAINRARYGPGIPLKLEDVFLFEI